VTRAGILCAQEFFERLERARCAFQVSAANPRARAQLLCPDSLDAI
jgi:hypothetical protein